VIWSDGFSISPPLVPSSIIALQIDIKTGNHNMYNKFNKKIKILDSINLNYKKGE
jgi:hypothetical protein